MTFGESTVDGESKDWQAACAGFMLSWSNDPCTLQVQVFPSGDVAVVDRKNTIDFLRVNAANTFRVQWGPPGQAQAYPEFSQNCTTGCQPHPNHGGTCLCDLSVEDTSVVLADPQSELPTEAELRIRLKIGAADPAVFSGAYTLCTTKQCTSNPDIRVHTRGTSNTPLEFGIDTIFEFVKTVPNHRPSMRKPSRFVLNRASIVHVGDTTEYKMLKTTSGISATCTGVSSENGESHETPCKQAVDDSVSTEWATKKEQAGAWITMDFDKGEETINRMVYSNRCGEFDRNKVVQLEFSDGTRQNITVPNHCDAQVFELNSPVKTSAVKLTIVETYATKPSASNGARMIRFLPVGNAFVSTASITPCEDSGMLPLTQIECEFAASRVQLPPGKTVGRGGSNTVGFYGSAPQKCSLWEADYSPHWNERQSVLNWDSAYLPLCKVARKANQAGPSNKTGFQFRNPPHFVPNTGEQAWMLGGYGTAKNPYGDADHFLSAAKHETEALLDHLFEHNNTAPFVAVRMIQRLIQSNPTPRFVEVVATAFQTGAYGHKTYSGEYGDMAAMTAAIMLDREARASILDADTAHGQMREPVLKVIHLLRALEYKSAIGLEVNLFNLGEKIGQFAFQSPTVFNFYLPEFSPAGPVQEAGLVAPEAQIATGPYLIGYLNGVASLIDNGLTSCDRGFGDVYSQAAEGDRLCELHVGAEQRMARSDGVLSFKPTHPDKAVDEMALLLTGGRLGKQTRKVLTDVYKSYINEEPFDMATGVAEAVAAMDSSMVPEVECSYAVKEALGILSPVAAVCEASTEQDEQHPCTNALDSTFGATQWNTQANWEGPPSGKLSSKIAQCLVDVKQALGNSHINQKAIEGSWAFIPPGCSYKTEDNRTWYNKHPEGRQRTEYIAVASDPTAYKGAWIKIIFKAGETLIDRMAYVQSKHIATCSS